MKRRIEWYSEQGSRFQSYLNNCNKELSDDQLDITLQDFLEYEDENGKMSQDTFNERLESRN